MATNVVIPSDLFLSHFDLGGAVPNQVSIRWDAAVSSGAGAPTAPPAGGGSPLYVDSGVSPHALYYWDGSVWNPVGDGVGSGADGNDFVTGASLGVDNVLTLTGPNGAGATVDLTSLVGTSAVADGVVTGGALSGTNQLVLTRSVGADITVDLSSLAGGGGGGGGGGTVTSVTGTAPIQVGGTPEDPAVSIDMAALVSALCATPEFQECIKTAAIGLIRDDGDGTFTAAHATDGSGNYVYSDCP